MIPQWLRRKASVSEWEKEYLHDGVPFGYCNREWEELKAKVLPGDEVWLFSSPQEDWEEFMGSEGIALVRAGEVVASFCTRMN